MWRAFLLLVALSGVPDISSDIAQDDFDDSVLLSVSSIPVLVEEYTVPHIDARAALIMDKGSGMVLYQKDSTKQLPMASLTKIMTAIIILEENDLDEVVKVDISFDDIEGSRMWLKRYEKLTVKKLLQALLISSSNDAAKMLAHYNAGSVEDFVEKMNKRALELGLFDTQFENPMGFDHFNHYSTARDLSMLTLYALKKPFFQKTVQVKEMTIHSEDGQFSHTLKNTNKLLHSYLNIKGVKTGTTDDAGQCLITLLKTDSGREVLTVLLNSPSRFQETKGVLENIIKNYK